MKSQHYLNKKGEQIDFTVRVHQRPNLRGGFDEMFMYQGKQILENMFDECKIDEQTTSFHLEYPERWANILELRAISTRMLVCYPNLIKATITTHSVYIVQCVHAQHILVDKLGEKYKECGYDDLSVKYCGSPQEMQGLWAMTPESIQKIT